MSKMPVLFVGHGSPMNAIENNEFTRSWESLGQSLQRPAGIGQRIKPQRIVVPDDARPHQLSQPLGQHAGGDARRLCNVGVGDA